MGRLLRRLAVLLRWRRFDDDLREELSFHQELQQRDAILAPASPKQRTPSILLTQQQSRDVWLPPWLRDIGQDVRFATRLLVKNPKFSLAAIAALSLGLGATTTAFTFVNGAMFRELPLADPDQLVHIRTVDARGRRLGVSYADVRDWRAATRTLSHVIVSFEFPINISEEGLSPQRFNGSFISHDVFDMVGHKPILGRAFQPDDDRDGAPRVAIIAHSVWQNRYGVDPGVIGRTVKVNDVPATIIGVMPERFHFPLVSQVWVPAGQASGPANTMDDRRAVRTVIVFAYGRLADGFLIQQAQAEMDAITGRLAREFSASNEGISVALEPIENVYWGGENGLRQMLLVVMGAVSFVLLIACVNVANLLLARAIHRSREIAIRTSLGATRGRIVRQLLVESVLLSVVAGMVSVALMQYGVRVFAAALTRVIEGDAAPFWYDFSIDSRVYGFLAIACLGTSLLFGLAPALHVSKTSNESLKDGGRGASGGSRGRRWTGALIVGQLSLTMVLLAGAALMVRSFVNLYQAGLVLDTTDMITMRLALGAQKYGQPAQRKELFRRLDEQLATVGAFSAVTVASDIPLMTLTNSQRQLTIEGRARAPEDAPPLVAYLYIGPRYFETLRLRLIRGREFSEVDGAPGQEAVIVNELFVSMFFPNADPIGQRIHLVNVAAPNAPQPWFTIVGVAPTIPQIVFRPEPVVYAALRGEPAPHGFASIIARASGDRGSLVKLLREEVRKVDPDLPGYYVMPMDDIVAMSRWPQRVFGAMFGLLAGIALVLASVGLYAVTAHGVVHRTQEIGIRVALGAQSTQIVWLFVKRTFVQLLIGVFIGLAGAIAVGRLLGSLLIQTAPTDPVALGLVSLLLVVVALAASIWPARRAARVDPVVALRFE